MPYSLKQAATASGKSKPTILRAIQSGKVSAAKDAQGEWQIDPAELHRVYEPVMERTVSNATPWNDTQQADSPIETALLRAEVEQMRERFASMEIDRDRDRREASDTIDDLRRRLDQSEQERRDVSRQLTALLTHDSPRHGESRGFWARLRRKG
jgi:predicted RNase H-like nuclease (RuvC/YqgF family)